MAQGVVYQEASGQIISANAAAQRILGLTLDQMKGLTSTDPRWRAVREDGAPFPGDDHPSMIALRTGQPKENVTMGVFNPAQNDFTWIRVSSVPQFRAGETAPFQVFATFDDITPIRRVEEELRKESQKYRHLFDNMATGIVYLDVSGTITWSNAAAQRILGLTFDKMQGRTVMDPAWRGVREDGSDLPGSKFPAMLALRTGKPQHNFVMGVFNPATKDTTWINVSAVPEFRPGEAVPYQVCATFEDITKLRNAEMAKKPGRKKDESGTR
jgi:PAS domain S-box-containing protein